MIGDSDKQKRQTNRGPQSSINIQGLWVICQEDIYHPQNSDIYHPQIRTFPTPKKNICQEDNCHPQFFFFFLAHFFWLFRLTAHGGHQGWEGGGAWWGGHGAHQVKGAWRGGHGAHQVGGGYHGGHGGRHGGGKVGWALCFCSWRLGSHISKEGGGSYPRLNDLESEKKNVL